MENLEDKTLFQKFTFCGKMLCASEILVSHTPALLVWEYDSFPWLLILLPFRLYLGAGTQPPPLPMKYILVTGGVISGIGKGIIASSIGTILKSCGLRVTAIKIDPYINIDAGTFSPYEHGMKEKNFPLL